jgi:hypothetical protein
MVCEAIPVLADLNPIKRVWKSKVPDSLHVRSPIDKYRNGACDNEVVESTNLSVWDFCEELRVAETERAGGKSLSHIGASSSIKKT